MSTQLHPSRTAATKDTGTPTIWLDGQWCDRATAMVSVYDHGLLYGDGVFEGIRVYGGKIFSSPSISTACTTPPMPSGSPSR